MRFAILSVRNDGNQALFAIIVSLGLMGTFAV